MRVGSDLRTKAFLALEEVAHECRYGVAERTHLLRFALAWLYSTSRTRDPEPFLDFWRETAGDNGVFRFQRVNEALARIYGAVGAPRDEAASFEMWRAAQARYERRSGQR